LRYSLLQLIQQFLTGIVIIIIFALVYIIARAGGYDVPGNDLLQQLSAEPPIPPKQVAIISGHAGFDSGAVCTDADGTVTLTEADVNAKITQNVADRLAQIQPPIDIMLLDEKDERLSDLQADVLLSLHSDSCINLNGYKAAFAPESIIPDRQMRLMACINNRYANATNLPYHSNTITHDMLGYHVFNRIDPQTPAAILEMGFMRGDQDLLTTNSDVVAQGIVDSLLCFLNDELWPTSIDQPEIDPADPNTAEKIKQN